MRRILWLTSLALVIAVAAQAETYFGFQIGVGDAPPPPRVYFHHRPALAIVPGSDVYYDDDDAIGADVFCYGGYWYTCEDGYWYRAASYNGPYRVVDVRYVPRSVLYVPARGGFRGGSRVWRSGYGWNRGAGGWDVRRPAREFNGGGWDGRWTNDRRPVIRGDERFRGNEVRNERDGRGNDVRGGWHNDRQGDGRMQGDWRDRQGDGRGQAGWRNDQQGNGRGQGGWRNDQRRGGDEDRRGGRGQGEGRDHGDRDHGGD